MPIGSPNPKKTFGQPVKVLGDIESTGDIKTRSNPGTGGGDVITRHVYAGGSPGGFHIQSTSGSNDFSIMPDGQPALNINLKVNGDATTWSSIELATGIFTVLSLSTDIDAGITFGIGNPNSGVAIATNAEARSFSNMDFTVIGWSLVTDVTQPLRVQIFKQAYSSYNNSTWVDLSGTSTGTGGMPRLTISSGIKNTSSDLSGWTVTSPTIARGDIVRAVTTNNGGLNGWFSLQLYGRRNVKKT